MSTAQVVGSAAMPAAQGTFPPSTQEEMDAAIADVRAQKDAWVAQDLPQRIYLLKRLIDTTLAQSQRWVEAACEAKGIELGTPGEGEEWLAGPMLTVRNLRLLRDTLYQLYRYGRIALPGRLTTRPSGQVVAQVFPTSGWDALLFQGFTGEVWMEPGLRDADVLEHQATIYRRKLAGAPPEPGKVALVLGAGNVSSIGPMDALYKLFAEDQVVVLKMNPVNEYLGPIFLDAFKPLADEGFFRVVYGGGAQGAYLCQHDGVDEIHITGSDKTHDAIVYGVGEEGRRNKENDWPINTKRITSELGNVSPVIVMPGEWEPDDLAFQAENLASMLANNAGFNCNATRVIITHRAWKQRDAFLDALEAAFQRIPTRQAYYPGAADRHTAFVQAHPDARLIGDTQAGTLPWTLIPDLAPDAANDICFTTEAFCSVFGEVSLRGDGSADPVAFLDEAVDFCNDTLWGTLNASILLPPSLAALPRVEAAVDRAIEALRYGSVAINHWPALSYGFVSTTWGAFPGHTRQDIGSGIGVVHNTYLFERPQKSVIRGPFHPQPKPPWLATHRTSHVVGRLLTQFEAKPGLWKLPAILAAVMNG